MPHDPVRVADARGWLSRARLDLTAGEADLGHSPSLRGDAMFHAQQAVEKALKAFLTWHEASFRKTYDLRELFASCGTVDGSLHALTERAAELTPYAWVFRYPAGAEETQEPEEKDAREALDIAREVYDSVLARLPSDVRP